MTLVGLHPRAAWLARLWHWLETGVWLPATPDAPSAPTYTLAQGQPPMSTPYIVTVNPPAAKDPLAVKLTFTYTITPDGGQAGAPTVIDATASAPTVGLNPGDTLTGSYSTADAAGVVSPESPAATIKAPTAPSAPTYTLANATTGEPPK